MQHLAAKINRIKVPRYGKDHRVMPPIDGFGSASYGLSVNATCPANVHAQEDTMQAGKTALIEGFRFFISGGGGFLGSHMHQWGASTIVDHAIHVVITTPYIADFEGVLGDTDMTLVARQGGFALRKTGFSIAGAEINNRGGPGTVDEVMQTLECIAYGDIHPLRPVAFCNRGNAWRHVLDQLRFADELGYLPPQLLGNLIIENTGADCIHGIKNRILTVPADVYNRITHFQPLYRGMNEGGVVQFTGTYNVLTRPWENRGTFRGPVIAMVTGRSVDEDPIKRERRHALIDDIDVERILGDIRKIKPSAIILFVNEPSRLARKIYDTARTLGLKTIGVQAVQATDRLMYDTGTTRRVDNTHLIDAFILDHADVVMPMDASLRSQSLLWQSMVYANIREPDFAGKEIIVWNKRDIAFSALAHISAMVRQGTINGRIFDSIYAPITEEEVGVYLEQILRGDGKRANVQPFPPPDHEKTRHLRKPSEDRIADLTPKSLRQLAKLIQPPRLLESGSLSYAAKRSRQLIHA